MTSQHHVGRSVNKYACVCDNTMYTSPARTTEMYIITRRAVNLGRRNVYYFWQPTKRVFWFWFSVCRLFIFSTRSSPYTRTLFVCLYGPCVYAFVRNVPLTRRNALVINIIYYNTSSSSSRRHVAHRWRAFRFFVMHGKNPFHRNTRWCVVDRVPPLMHGIVVIDVDGREYKTPDPDDDGHPEWL